MLDSTYYESRSYRLTMLMAVLQTCSNLSMWCYSGEGDLFFSSNPYAKELGAFWEIGGCKEYALTVGKTLDKPFVMSDSMGLMWVGEYSEVKESIGRVLVLMGPSFLVETSPQTIEQRMRDRDISLTIRSACRKALMSIPVLSMRMLNEYIKMLHYTATQMPLKLEDVVYQTDIVNLPAQEVLDAPPTEQHFMDYEKAYETEERILQCIREGNLNYDNVLGPLSARRKLDNYLTGDPIREAKISVNLFISKCARAAIAGKMSIKAAKETELRYIRRVEYSTNVTQIAQLRSAALDEFVSRIHELQANPGISQPIRDTCDYVKAHFMEEITLADIAKSVCYTEYYLTRKFQKEMGISLREYIWNTRLEYAKIQLASTEDSIQDISDQLHFGTRNHFTRIFRETQGCTPTEYRERTRMIHNN